MKFRSWEEEVKREREFKNNFFKAHPNSPIPISEREEFKGLKYFPINLEYRLELKLYRHKEKTMVKMRTTHGEEQEYVKSGEFRFDLNGKECRLQAYKRGEEEWLFVPFKDKTCGNETYGAGRYLELRPDEHKVADGMWILDFNRAYNPWCAYNEDYACPFTPPENWLEISILAGEKIYRSKL